MSKKPYDPIMYIVVRRDLEMPSGKLAGQVAHAAVRLIWKFRNHTDNGAGRSNMRLINEWFHPSLGNEAKIVLGVSGYQELESIYHLADKLKIPTEIVTDAGRTIFGEPTVTCIGIGPLTQEEAKSFKHLKLY